MKHSWFPVFAIAMLVLAVGLGGCREDRTLLLDPEDPVTVTLWSYGGETYSTKLRRLFDEFNDTLGREKGVVVEGSFFIYPEYLAKGVYEATTGKVGARHHPDMFCSYPNNAYRIHRLHGLADLGPYFSEAELREFFPSFLHYGTIDGKLLLLPVAKSTEALFLNATDWRVFAAATGHSLEDLRTWEGLARTAAAYYAWTDARTPEPGDGQAFLSVDYFYHMLLIGGEQLGKPLFSYVDGTVLFHLDREVARRVWDCFYIPFIMGHYANDFKYMAMNVKQGMVIGGVTTTAHGSVYFPAATRRPDGETVPIDCLALPYPVFAGGRPCAPLRGGQDICVFAGNLQREQACAVFLKWFVERHRNMGFTLSHGYLPVKTAALDSLSPELLDTYAAPPAARAVYPSLRSMLAEYRLYKNPPFSGDVRLEKFLNTCLPQLIQEDMDIVRDRIHQGIPREEALAPLLGPEHFDAWYRNVTQRARELLEQCAAAGGKAPQCYYGCP